MKLSVAERLTILGVLPQKGKYDTLIHAKAIREAVAISSDEAEAIELEAKEGGLTWDGEKAEEKDIEFNAKQAGIIADALDEMNEKGELTAQHISCYEKFCT